MMIKKTVIFLFISLSCLSVNAQMSADTVRYKRGIFVTRAYGDLYRLNNKNLDFRYRAVKAYDSKRLLRDSKILLPVGAVTTAGGIFVGADAVIGTRKIAYINNTEAVYYERPILQLIGGIGLTALGVALMEYGNDAKIKSIDLYNRKYSKATFGWTQTGRFGFNLEL